MAKLSVNAMIGLWARSTEVVYSVRSSSSELDGAGADFSQAFAYEGGMVWDFVYARRLLSHRPIHEHCMVAKARRILDAPPRYLAQVKTDCLLTQRLPKRFAERLRALKALRHPDGTPVYRVEETKPLLGAHGGGAAQTTEVERGGRPRGPLPGGQLPAAHGPAGHRKDAPGPDHCGEAARAGRGGAPGVQDALLRAEPGAESADGRPLGAQVRAQGSAQKLDWLVVEEIAQLDMALWADLACVGLNADVKFLLLGDFRQLPAVLDSWAGRPISAPLEHSQLAGGRAHGEHALRPQHLQLCEVAAGRRGGVPHAGAGQGEAEGALPLQARVAGHHAGHQPQQAHGRDRALAPEGSKLLQLEVIHIDLGETQNGCDKSITQGCHE